MDIIEIIIIAIAAFLSAIIKNGVGVGAGIFLLPVLSLVFPAKTALGLGGPIMLASDLIGMRYYWKEWVSTKEFLKILLPAVPGMLIGTWLIPVIPSNIFRSAVAIFGTSYALMLLFPQWPPFMMFKSISTQVSPKNLTLRAIFYGFFAGVATVVAHAGGLVWSIYLMSIDIEKRKFVGTIVLLFAVTNTYKTGAYVFLGLISISTLMNLFLIFPIIFIGCYIGNMFNKRIDKILFRKIVLVTIFIVSACLFR
jgi:uncharacterized membrane protein YfcA